MVSIDAVWERTRSHAGQQFRTTKGLPFVYEVPGTFLRTNRNLSRTNFAKALSLMPVDGPGNLAGRQGASYTRAILMDRRIREEDW